MAADRLNKIIQQIEDKLAEADKHLITALQAELSQRSNTSAHQAVANAQPVIDSDSGCYRFEGDANFYCPHCFDRMQQRVTTQRINRLLRVCTQCHQSLKPAKK